MNILNNIKLNMVIFSLGMLVVLAFSALSAEQTAAFSGYHGGTPIDTSYQTQVTNNTSTNNPSPVITSISPSSSTKGVGTKTVTITGDGFIPGSVARMNGSDRTTTFIDSSHLLIKLGETDLNRNDPFFITVFNRAPGGGYSNAATFTITDTAAGNTVNSNNNSGTTNVENSPDTFSETPSTVDSTEEDGAVSDLAATAIFGSNSFMPSGIIQWILFAILVLVAVIIVRRIYGGAERYHAIPMKHD